MSDVLRQQQRASVDAYISRLLDLSFYSPVYLICPPDVLRRFYLEQNCLAVTAPNYAPAAITRQLKFAALCHHADNAMIEMDSLDAQSEYPDNTPGDRFGPSPTDGTSVSGTDTPALASLDGELVLEVLPFPPNPFCLLACGEIHAGRKGCVAIHVVLPFFLFSAPTESVLSVRLPDSGSLSQMPLEAQQEPSDFILFDCFLAVSLDFNPCRTKLELSHLQKVVACSGRFHSLSRCTHDTHPWSFDWDTMLDFAADQLQYRHNDVVKTCKVLVDNFTIKQKSSRKRSKTLPGGLKIASVQAQLLELLERFNHPSVRQSLLLASKWHLFQTFLQDQRATAVNEKKIAALSGASSSVGNGWLSQNGNLNNGDAAPDEFHRRTSPFYFQDIPTAPAPKAVLGPGRAWASASNLVNDAFRDASKEQRLNMFAKERDRLAGFLASPTK